MLVAWLQGIINMHVWRMYVLLYVLLLYVHTHESATLRTGNLLVIHFKTPYAKYAAGWLSRGVVVGWKGGLG